MRIDENSIIFSLEPIKESSCCPECGEIGHRVHSVYIRSINDLPVFNYKVQLKVIHDSKCPSNFQNNSWYGKMHKP